MFSLDASDLAALPGALTCVKFVLIMVYPGQDPHGNGCESEQILLIFSKNVSGQNNLAGFISIF